MYEEYQLHPPYGFWEEDFLIIFENLHFLSPWQLIKFSDLDKNHMKHGGLLNKHFCKNKIPSIPIETEKNAIFHFSHYKPMENISSYSNQSSNPTGIKKKTQFM